MPFRERKIKEWKVEEKFIWKTAKNYEIELSEILYCGKDNWLIISNKEYNSLSNNERLFCGRYHFIIEDFPEDTEIKKLEPWPGYKKYDPLNNPPLFYYFAHLHQNDTPSEESKILKWVKTYGLPYDVCPDTPPILLGIAPKDNKGKLDKGRLGKITIKLERKLDEQLQRLYGSNIISVANFLKAARLANYALDLYNSWEKRDTSRVYSLLHHTQEFPKKGFDIDIAPSYLSQIFEPFMKGIILTPQVSRNTLTKEIKINYGYKIPNLLSAMWLQFYKDITGTRKLLRCHECNGLFRPTDEGQLFCPPNEWQIKSSCANRFYVREYRKRKNNRGS